MLEPTARSEGTPMELTAWIAFTDATRENGCLKLIPGSHRTWRYDEKASLRYDDTSNDHTFFGYDYSELRLDKDWDPDAERVAHLEMKAGQFIIFTARCIHGSNPNVSRKQRMGFSARRAHPCPGVRRHDGVRRVRSPLRPVQARLRPRRLPGRPPVQHHSRGERMGSGIQHAAKERMNGRNTTAYHVDMDEGRCATNSASPRTSTSPRRTATTCAAALEELHDLGRGR